ncbi:MAG: hypothetical protein JWR04_1073 [Rhodoglobus sp.]|nr:hypothetical protein [Rhodoglobus sp.]
MTDPDASAEEYRNGWPGVLGGYADWYALFWGCQLFGAGREPLPEPVQKTG